MYSNNILNFRESTTILNACTKKLLKAPRIYIYIYKTASFCDIFIRPIHCKCFLQFPIYIYIYIYSRKQILLAYSLPEETVVAIMMHYKNTKVNVVLSPDGDTELFDIVTCVLQGDTLPSYPFIICFGYVFRASIDLMKKCLYFGKGKKQKIPGTNDYDIDYADDIEVLANIADQAISQLHILERAADGIGLHRNADKTEFIGFNKSTDISILNGRSLKLVDKLAYLGSGVLSTENDINTRLAKTWTAINKLSVRPDW